MSEESCNKNISFDPHCSPWRGYFRDPFYDPCFPVRKLEAESAGSKCNSQNLWVWPLSSSPSCLALPYSAVLPDCFGQIGLGKIMKVRKNCGWFLSCCSCSTPPAPSFKFLPRAEQGKWLESDHLCCQLAPWGPVSWGLGVGAPTDHWAEVWWPSLLSSVTQQKRVFSLASWFIVRPTTHFRVIFSFCFRLLFSAPKPGSLLRPKVLVIVLSGLLNQA